MAADHHESSNTNDKINFVDKDFLHLENKSDLIEAQNHNGSSWNSDNHINIDDISIQEKFTKIHLQISSDLQNANILWSIDASVYPHIGYLPYLLIMNLMHKSNKRLTLISDMQNYINKLNDDFIEQDSKMISCYEIFSNFNIGTIMKFDDIYYTKDYQKSFFRVTHSIKIADAIECLRKKMPIPIDINMESTSNLIFILLILNNIIYFDISHVLIGEHELSLYELIKSLLLDKYGRILNILEIPMFPNVSENKNNSQSMETNQILLDSSQYQIYDQILGLESRRKTMICNYFKVVNNLFSHEQILFETDTNLVDSIENMKRRILLSSNLHNNYPIYVAASFLTDQFYILKKHWKKHTNKKDSSTGTGKSLDGIEGNREGFEPPLGGKFIIINWFNKEIVYMLDLDAPAGFFIDSNHLYIANNRLNYISVIDLNTRTEIRRIENRVFNCLHSIHYMKENQTILVTSTGIDAIIQINLQGEILNDWYGTEHEYTMTPKGEKRIVSRDFDHHHYTYPTLHQTTHVNSAIILNEEYILATLFHQGSLVRIDRRSGKSKILLSELNCPHGIKRFKSIKKHDIEWMLCNTKLNEILFLDDGFTITQKMFLEDVHWLQDASQMQNGNIIIADANNSRIIEIDPISNTVTSEFNYSTDWRIYQISDLTDFQTSFIPTQTE
ncbi:unnamed protein product [Rotaria sp. Silwood1]|nr:unnamed protein product [Rotaria sp. Silwood1]CAF4824554.1 unnamed protein product [Rotaria sp. Silwood1]